MRCKLCRTVSVDFPAVLWYTLGEDGLSRTAENAR